MASYSTTCGRCGRVSNMRPVSESIQTETPWAHIFDIAFSCDHCKRLNLLAAVVSKGGLQNRRESWLPRHQETIEFPDVPEQIAEAATEATLCHSVGAYRAVGSLARAVIEATAKDKGANGSDLYSRIEQLHTDGHIRPHTKEQAHEVRHFGNGMAHGDFTNPVEQAEAEEVIELMKEILDEVYQSPARLDKVRSARVAKKAAAANPPSAASQPGNPASPAGNS